MTLEQAQRYLAGALKDPTIIYLVEQNLPLTRTNYLRYNFPGGVPDPWPQMAEEEELPEELQNWDLEVPRELPRVQWDE